MTRDGEPVPVDVAVRGWVQRRTPRPRRRGGGRLPIQRLLLFDTETLTGRVRCVDEGLFYADDLPLTDPDGYARLQSYAATRWASTPGRRRRLRLLSRGEFVEQVFYRAAYKARATVVGFNLPFDLTRIAAHAGTARTPRKNRTAEVTTDWSNAFTLSLWRHDGQHNRYRPAIRIRHVNRHFSFIAFTSAVDRDVADCIPDADPTGEPDEQYVFPGHFLDLRTMAFALTNTSHSLASAAEAFDCTLRKSDGGEHGLITNTYIDYCRNDVAVTSELAENLLLRYDTHPIDLHALPGDGPHRRPAAHALCSAWAYRQPAGRRRSCRW